MKGMPINHKNFASTAADVESSDNVTRRVECGLYPQFVTPSSSSSTPLLSKRPLQESEGRLRIGPNTTSLIDDDDDVVDYFAPAKRPRIAGDDVCASSSIWKVQEHQVPTLPAFFPLERSSTFVPKASPSTLASRIVSVLQACSIAASYDDSNAVDCISKAEVEFRVRMYRGRDEYHDGIIVEVQRLYGFDLSYIQDVYAILDAARESQTRHEESGTVAKSASEIHRRPSLQSFARSA